MTPVSLVVRAALVSGLFLSAVPALAVAQKGGRSPKTIDSDKPVESQANKVSRKIHSDLEDRDFVDFAMKHDKQLSLTPAQKDSLKAYSKAMDNDQKPVFKEIQKALADADRDATLAGGRASMPPIMRELIGHLNEIQDTYTAKAKSQLNEGQQHMSDSLYTAHMAEVKEKGGNERGGRGGV